MLSKKGITEIGTFIAWSILILGLSFAIVEKQMAI